MRGVVTGGAGYIGSALISSLLGENYNVLSIDNLRSGDYKFLESYRKDRRLKLVVSDICDRTRLEQILRDFGNIDVIFHLAAISDLVSCRENPEEAIEVNVLGTFNVLEVARKLDIRRVIFASSASVYGIPEKLPVDEEHPLRPANLMGVTKIAGENLMSLFHDNYGLETVILRFGNVYGVGLYTRWDSVIPRFVRLGLEGKPLTIYGDGSSSRDFVHVRDITESMRLSAEADVENVNGEIFNIGGETMMIEDLAKLVKEEIRKIEGRTVEVTHLPPRIGETREFSYSMDKIMRKLGFQPRRTIREGVRQIIKYLEENGNVNVHN